MSSKATQARITDLQKQLVDTQRKVTMYSMPYLGPDGKTPVESAMQAGRDPKTGKPLDNPDWLPQQASMYLQDQRSIQQQLAQAQQQAETEDQPNTTVHTDGGGGLVAVTTTKNPDDAGSKVTASQITPDTKQQRTITNIPGVGVGVVNPDGNFQMVWQQQGLTPDQKTTAMHEGLTDYISWLGQQTAAGTLDERRRDDLFNNAQAQWQDQLDLMKTQQKQNEDDETARRDAASYDSTNLRTATDYGHQMAQDEIATFPHMAGPNLGSDFAANFQRIGANPAAGLSNIQFQPGDFNFTAPDPTALAAQRTSQLLASVSPYARLQLPAGAQVTQPGAVPQIPQPGVAPAGPPTPAALGANLIAAGTEDPISGTTYGANVPPAASVAGGGGF